MKTVTVIEPDGSSEPGKEHEIPEADLQGFLDNGWTCPDKTEKPKKNK